MEAINANQILGQMRALAAQAGLQEVNTASVAQQVAPAPREVAFGDLLKSTIQQVNQQQQVGNQLAADFEMEKPGVDLSTVMIEKQKASIAFEALMQFRNRVVSAYQEVMSMPI